MAGTWKSQSGRHVFDIDQYPQGPGPAGQVARLAFWQAGDEEELQGAQNLVRGVLWQQARLNPCLGQQGRPALALRPPAGQAGLEVHGD